MSESGHQRTWRPRNSTSALPPKADSNRTSGHVRLVPFPDSCTAAKQHPYSITSLASASSLSGRSSPSVLAVLRLITSSYLMGACIGKAGPRERWDQWTYIRGGFLSRAGRGRIHY